MLDRVQEHLVDAVGEVLLLWSRQDGPKLPEELSEQDIGQRLIVVVRWIDANYLRERIEKIAQIHLSVHLVLLLEFFERSHDFSLLLVQSGFLKPQPLD